MNQAYEKSASKYDWPGLHRKFAIVVRANDNRYSLPANFQKFDFVYLQNVLCKKVDMAALYASQNAYAVDLEASDIVFSTIPGTASTAFTMQSDEAPGNAVVIELNSVSGIAVGDRIWVNGTTTPEFTIVTAVNATAITITARLKQDPAANDILYRVDELIYCAYWRTITAFTGTGTENSLLPDATDLIVPYYAAYLYHKNLENEAKAQMFLTAWEEQLAEVWHSQGKTSSGDMREFSVF